MFRCNASFYRYNFQMSHLFNSPFLRNHKIKIDQDHKSSDSTCKENISKNNDIRYFSNFQITIIQIFPEIVKRKFKMRKYWFYDI